MNYRSHIFYCFPTGNYQVDPASSTYIVIVIKINFTAPHWIQIAILYIFYTQRWFTNLFLFHFQIKDSNTHA